MIDFTIAPFREREKMVFSIDDMRKYSWLFPFECDLNEITYGKTNIPRFARKIFCMNM